jgi:glutamyl-tRNA synthetase
MPDVVTRFAPSPTGHLHIGGARTALFCWAFARKHRGVFTLRIEDTDQARSSDESARGIMEDLAWLGIDWDQGPEFTTSSGTKIGGDPFGVGPFFQARRVKLYNEHLMRLVEQGLAYPAFEKTEELEIKRKAAVAAKQTYRYDRAALREMPEIRDRLKRMESGEPHVIRFFVPDEPVRVQDEVLGEVKYAAGEVDDFVIRKADGFPTYHFAVVVDDQTMGVTHVMRAQEHLNNTPRHVALQKALGFRTPVYAHMPLICNMDSSKMSKRDKAKAARAAIKQAAQKEPGVAARLAAETGLGEKTLADFVAGEIDTVEVATAIGAKLNVALPEIEVADFRENGYLPEAINNFVALLGWNPGMKLADGKDLEKFDNAFLCQHFSVERIGKTSAKFDRTKLMSFNADAINGLADDVFAARWRAWCAEFSPEIVRRVPEARWGILATAVKARAKTFREASKPCAFAMLDDGAVVFDKAAAEKNLLASDRQGLALLRAFREAFVATFPESAGDEVGVAPSHGLIETLAKDRGLGMGPVAQAIRVALAGVAVTPPLGETMAVLGRRSTLTRLDRCLAEFGG